MAMRDAGDYGFGMSFEDAVKKGRAERWSDRDIAALLKCTEEEVRAIPGEPEVFRLEDLKFRDDPVEGGKVIEYVVDGRVKTQTIPMMVGKVLEAVVNRLALIESELEGVKNERLVSTDGKIGSEREPARRGPKPSKRSAVRRRSAGKKEKANDA